jgi:L-lactate dehydrogenase complex protein LldG
MTDARTEILSRIREALGPDGGSTPAGAVPREYRSAGEHAPGSDVVLDLLIDRLVDYKAHVHRATPAEIPALLARLVTASAGTSAARASVVVPGGLDAAWLSALDGVDVRTDSREAPLSAAELDEIDAVVTAARVAVAETGTIVLDGAPDQGRRAISLVPDVHVCVVRTDQVVQTVPEAVRLLGTDPARPLTWISGPSATSDIELDRVEGVHGPRTLHVVLVS